jgi:hypothetical protein
MQVKIPKIQKMVCLKMFSAHLKWPVIIFSSKLDNFLGLIHFFGAEFEKTVGKWILIFRFLVVYSYLRIIY